MRKSRLIITLLGALALLLSGIAIGPSAAGASTGVNDWLESVGANPAQAVYQEGLLNYAGPTCPGASWNCTGTEKPVVQTADSLGTNIFECPPSQDDCVAVQRGSDGGGQLAAAGLFGGVASAAPGAGPNNLAVCNQNNSGQQAMPVTMQACVGASFNQENTTGKNGVIVNQIINQNDEGSTINQVASQRAIIMQTNQSGENLVKIHQKIHQIGKSKGSTQTQLGLQFVKIDQMSTTGAQSVNSMQDQVQDLKVAGATGAVSQMQNVVGNPDGDCGPENCRNAYLEVNQESTSGKQDVTSKQSINSLASADGGTSVSQSQGAMDGGVRAALHQHSSGISTIDSDQTETQKLDVNTTGAVSQSQIGPPLCCPPITGLSQTDNPDNVTLMRQRGFQTAGPDAFQFKRMTGQQFSSGQTTIDQRSCQNGECQEFVTGPQTGFVRSDVVCTEGTCTQFRGSSNGERVIPLIEDCSPGVGCDAGQAPSDCEAGDEDCGDMLGPVDGRVQYSQDPETLVLSVAIEVLTAQPNTTYQVFLVCGPVHASACGFNTVHHLKTNAAGFGATSFFVTPSQFPPGCGARTDHIDLLKGVGDDSAGLYAATPVTYSDDDPCPEPA